MESSTLRYIKLRHTVLEKVVDSGDNLWLVDKVGSRILYDLRQVLDNRNITYNIFDSYGFFYNLYILKIVIKMLLF